MDQFITVIKKFILKQLDTGADPGFSFRGGTKDYVRSRTPRARRRSPLRPGSRARLRALEALGFFFFMLSRASWELFVCLLIQNGIKKTLVDQIFRGGGAFCTPLWIRHWDMFYIYPFYYSILSSVVVSHDKNKRNRHHNNKFAVKHKKSNI